jgi:ComF family protein
MRASIVSGVFRDLLTRSSLDWRLPSSCSVCESWQNRAVCLACSDRFVKPVPRCTSCAVTLASAQVSRCGACLSLGSALDACAAAVDYAYPWDRLIMRLKYADRGTLSAQPGLAKALAEVMQLAAANSPALAQALRTAQAGGWIVAVPLHPERQRERGFNQAHELAKALFPKSERIRSDLLLRLRPTAVQASLPKDARIHNLKNAFAAAPLRAHELSGQDITLIDDVATTTATLQSAAMALRQAGARSVQAIVLARAP